MRQMQEWEAEPQRRRRWYEQVARHADGLLKALSLVQKNARSQRKIEVEVYTVRDS